MPLDDAYSFDFGTAADKLPINSDKVMGCATKNATDATNSATKDATDKTKAELSEDEKKILALIKAEPQITQKKLQQATGISLGTIKRILPKLQEKGVITRTGSRRSGKWNIRE